MGRNPFEPRFDITAITIDVAQHDAETILADLTGAKFFCVARRIEDFQPIVLHRAPIGIRSGAEVYAEPLRGHRVSVFKPAEAHLHRPNARISR